MGLSSSSDVVIVGAGIAGLACAFRLVESAAFKRGELKVTLLEASSRAGGIIETLPVGECLLESGPDSFITTSRTILDLAGRLGIEDKIISTNTRCRGAMVVSSGALVKLPEGFTMLAPTRALPFLESPILSLRGRLRALAEPFVPVRSSSRDESVADFVRRRFGEELLQKIAQPMVGGIYVGDVEKLSAAMGLSRFVGLEQKRGSVIGGLLQEMQSSETTDSSAQAGVRYAMFCSFDKGMLVLVDALCRRLALAAETGNFSLQYDTPVTVVENLSGSKASGQQGTTGSAQVVWRIHSSALADPIDCRELVFALPARTVASILSGRANPANSANSTDHEGAFELSTVLDEIDAASSAVVNFVLPKSAFLRSYDAIDAFGVVIPEVERRKHKINSLAISFADKKFPGRAPADTAVLRVFLGGTNDLSILDRSNAELTALALADLRKLLYLNPDHNVFGRGATPVKVCRWPAAMPQYNVGHLEKLDKINRSLKQTPGLHLIGASYTGVGLPECVRGGETSADNILAAAGLQLVV